MKFIFEWVQNDIVVAANDLWVIVNICQVIFCLVPIIGSAGQIGI